MEAHVKRAAGALAFAFSLVVLATAAPAHAAAPPANKATESFRAARPDVNALPPNGSPSPAQLAAARAYANAHPMQGTVIVTAGSSPAFAGISPYVAVQVNYWGLRIYLTNQDLHNIIVLVATVGFAGAAAILCTPGGPWIALACAIGGSVVGYLVAEIVWQYIWSNHGCGAYIDINWNLRWGWGSWC